MIMSMEIYERTMRLLSVYKDIELSKKQAENGQIMDARSALNQMRKKYGI